MRCVFILHLNVEPEAISLNDNRNLKISSNDNGNLFRRDTGRLQGMLEVELLSYCKHSYPLSAGFARS